MKEQEKQIEEMAKVYCDFCMKQTGEKVCEYQADKECNIFFECGLFYKNGYRNCKDKVVLSREEYESDLTFQYDIGYEFGSKETAEKILKELLKGFAKNFYEKNMSMTEEEFGWVIDEIAREFSVEIKE